jgi:DNA-directed RNA polymerase specialized sigma subunit
MKTIIHKANETEKDTHSPSTPDEKKVADYVFSNFSPLIGHAVRKLKSKGHLPPNTEEDDHHENGINGLMHAIHSYKPEVGPFKPYALRTIMGHILTANKPKQVSQADYKKIKSFKQDGDSSPKQMIQPKDSSRRVVEELGQSFEEGGEGGQSSGVAMEKDPSMGAANIVQNNPQAKEWLQSKIEQSKRKLNPNMLSEDARKRFEAVNQARSAQGSTGVTSPTAQPAPQAEQLAPQPSQHSKVVSSADMSPEEKQKKIAELEALYGKK